MTCFQITCPWQKKKQQQKTKKHVKTKVQVC